MKKKIEIIGAILSIVLGIPSIWFAFESYKHEKGGEMMAFFNSSRIDNVKSPRSVIICLEDESTDISGVEFVPVFSNSSRYTLKDFDLKFSVRSDGIECVPNGFFSKTRYTADTDIFSYTSDKIPSFSRTPYPFESIKIDRGGGKCTITTTATYDGAPEPFSYDVDVVLKVVPSRGLDFARWKELCDSKISRINLREGLHDIYYIGLGKVEMSANANFSAHESSTDIAETRHESEHVIPAPKQKPTNPETKVIPQSAGNFPGLLDIREFSYNKVDSSLSVSLAPVVADGFYVFAWKDDNQKSNAFGKWLSKGSVGFSEKLWKNIENVAQVWQLFPDTINADIAIETPHSDGNRQIKVRNNESYGVFVVFQGGRRCLMLPAKGAVTLIAEDIDVDSVTTYSLPSERTVWDRVFSNEWRAAIISVCGIFALIYLIFMFCALFSEGPVEFFLGPDRNSTYINLFIILVCVSIVLILYYTA